MIQNWKHKFRYIGGILILLLCLLTGCTGTADGTAGRTEQDSARTVHPVRDRKSTRLNSSHCD